MLWQTAAVKAQNVPATLPWPHGVPHVSTETSNEQTITRRSANAAADCRSASTECDAAAAAAASRCDTAGGTGNDYCVLYYGDERSLI